MNQTMFRVVKDKENPYVMLNKGFLQDTELSLKAKGLLAYLLSMPDDWQIYESELVKHHTDGRDSIKTAIKELIQNGYIERERERNDKGYLKAYKYCVYEVSTRSGKSNVGKSNVGESVTTNNNCTNNNNTNTLHHSKNDGYVFFNDLEDKDLVRQINVAINSKRKRISKSNYFEAMGILEDYGLSEINEYIDIYTDEKKTGKSVETFIKYIQRYERE